MSNRSSVARRTAGIGIKSVCVLAALALPISVHAAPESQIAISYEVQVGSMSAMRISYTAALSNNAYRSNASIKTKGLASMFSDYQMEMAASGALDDGGIRPERYRSQADKKNEEKILEVSWRGGDPPAVNSTPKDKEDEALVAKGLTPGLIDPLSMLLRMTALQSNKPCRGIERVVDGREVYDLGFALSGEVTLGSDNPGRYRGKAFKCSMTYTPVAGRPAVKYRKSGGKPSKFDIWFAPVKSRASGEDLLVPVLATGRLKGLRFVAYARKATIDGQPLGAEAD